jgi:hypothetical protein
MDIATDYDGIFKNKLVIITGVARSGTTILGKIVGSFSNAHYLFEPSVFFLIPPLIQKNYLAKKEGSALLKAVLFEDMYLQVIQGRYVNFNENDDSFIGNYANIEDVKKRWKTFERKVDVQDYLKKNEILYVLKMPDISSFYGLLKETFPGVKFIDIVRDGNDIVSSSIRRDFYSTSDLNERIVSWSYMTNNFKVPWFIDKKNRKLFTEWNYPTRVAHIWRVLTEKGLYFARKNKDDVLQFKLEDFIENPDLYVEKIERFVGLNKTDITKMHIDSVRGHKPREYPDNISGIESPEKEKFIELRKKLGYTN